MGFIFIIVLVVIVWALLAQGTGHGFFSGSATTTTPPVTETPLEILKKRYARGEIDRSEFESRKRDLVS